MSVLSLDILDVCERIILRLFESQMKRNKEVQMKVINTKLETKKRELAKWFRDELSAKGGLEGAA